MIKDQIILRVVAKALFGPILVFALYVQFHGDYGPGGGFQAGVIFAAAFILYAIVFGVETAKKVTPPAFLRVVISAGVLMYAGVGVFCLFKGKNFLDYSALSADPVAGQHLGILLIELGVGTSVAAVMVLVFLSYAGRRRTAASRAQDGEDWV